MGIKKMGDFSKDDGDVLFFLLVMELGCSGTD
jgi:hypothetical protein